MELSLTSHAGFHSADHLQGEAVSSSFYHPGYLFSTSPSPTNTQWCSVPEAEERADLQSPWFVFNDFVVRNVSEKEALSFPGTWKVSEVTEHTIHRALLVRRRFPLSSIWRGSMRIVLFWISVNYPMRSIFRF